MSNTLLLGIGAIFGYVSRYISILFGLFFFSLRLKETDANILYNILSGFDCKKFTLYSEYIEGNRKPDVEYSLFLYKIPIILDIKQVEAKAGYRSHVAFTTITTIRPFRKKLLSIISHSLSQKEEYIKVYSNTSWGDFRLTNKIKNKKYLKIDDKSWTNLISIIDDFKLNNRESVGILLYGSPGNGKSSIIRNIAFENKYDIFNISLEPEISNTMLVETFCNLPKDKKIIIVLEDFDRIFNKKKSLLKDAKFTLDTLLNLIDGNLISKENHILFITANDINMIDKAIKHRPSRCDLIINVDNPQLDEIISILTQYNIYNVEDMAKYLVGQSGAIICEIGKRFRNSACDFEEIDKILDSFNTPDEPILDNNDGISAELKPVIGSLGFTYKQYEPRKFYE